jgi:LPS-assembly lipoprotein
MKFSQTDFFRYAAIAAAMTALSACGFHMRGEAQLPAGMQRVHVQIADPYSPLLRNLEAALKRSGATVESAAGDGIAEISIPTISLAPVVRSVGANAFVNEFSMVYHLEMQITDANGKVLMPKEVIEHSREFTFDQTQAIGTSAEQDEIKKEMERDMVPALLRKIEAAARKTQK